MQGAEPILHVALPVPLRTHFDYLPPRQVADLRPGTRLEVPFRNRKRIGVLLTLAERPTMPGVRLLRAHRLLDSQPLWTAPLLKLLRWSCHYYQHPIGEVAHAAMPRLLRTGRELPSWQLSPPPRMPDVKERPRLNLHQQQAVEQVLAQSGYRCYLVDGVTGSGKTEVYMRVIEPLLQAGRQALVLLPEIGMTPQNLERFQARFAVPIAVLHSGLTPSQQLRNWQQARTGEAAIVIGTRSAVWACLARPGIIIVDEEHDRSYRQQDGMRYSARDVAVARARLEDVPVVLGSASPSLESLLNARRRRYHHLKLPLRAGNRPMPRMHVLDLRRCRMQGAVSPMLEAAISEQLKLGQQVLLFLNRRGYAHLLLCHECGWRELCPHCDHPLILYRNVRQLRCHHCGFCLPRPVLCRACNAGKYVELGHGTEHIELALEKHFPGACILRIDSDLAATPRARGQALKRIHSGEADVLVGTQMIATGHHFEAIGLVGVIDADRGLHSIDFRAAEHLAQQIVQVGGRAGRGKTPGTVLIQSHLPNHPLLRALVRGGYRLFARIALAERRAAGLPPYTRMALLHAESKRARAPETFLRRAHQLAAKTTHNVQLSAPHPAPFPRRAGYYRWQLTIIGKHSGDIGALLGQWLPALEREPTREVRWAVEVDPST